MIETEKELMQAAINLAQSYGWLVYHTFNSRRSEPGFPDLILVRRDKLLAIECKSEKGRVTPAQQSWLAALDEVRHVTAFVLRPGPNLNELKELLR